MNTEDAKFLIENDPATAASVAQLSLRHGNDMWKVLFEEGLAKTLSKSPASRKDMVERLYFVPKTEDALLALKFVMAPLKPKQREALFEGVRAGGTIVEHWMSHARTHIAGPKPVVRLDQGRVGHLKALMEAVKGYGVDLNAHADNALKSGKTYPTSLLSELLVSHFYSSAGDKDGYKDSIALVFELGVTLDEKTKLALLKNPARERIIPTVCWFEEAGHAKAEEWLTAADQPGADPQNVALIQAHLAKKAIDSVGEPRRAPAP